MKTLLTFIAAAYFTSSVFAAAPYPLSSTIRGVKWDPSTYTFGGEGGDIWPTTWVGTGNLISAWGDGIITCPSKVSYGTAILTSGTPNAAPMSPGGCGPLGTGKGKIMAMGSAGNYLFASLSHQDPTGIPNRTWLIMRSGDNGKTWQKGFEASWSTTAYVNFGKGNEGAPEGYLYFITSGFTDVRLGRVLPAKWNDKAAYQWFDGTSSAPHWRTASSNSGRVIFTDKAGIRQPTLQYIAGLKRYLLVGTHTFPGEVGIFESANPWGPWQTVDYT